MKDKKIIHILSLLICLFLCGCGPHPSVPEERRIASEDHIAGVALVTDQIDMSSRIDSDGIWHICSSEKPWEVRDYKWIFFEGDPDDKPADPLLTEYGTKKEITQTVYLDPENHIDHIDIWHVIITMDGEIIAKDSGIDLLPEKEALNEEFEYLSAYTDKTPEYARKPYGGEANPKTKYRHKVVIRINAEMEDYDPDIILEESDGNGKLITKNRFNKTDLTGDWILDTEPDYRVSENCRKLAVHDSLMQERITESKAVIIRSKDESGLIFDKIIGIDFRDGQWTKND